MSKKQIERAYNRLVNRAYGKFSGGTSYGVDSATLRTCYPKIWADMLRLKELYSKES